MIKSLTTYEDEDVVYEGILLHDNLGLRLSTDYEIILDRIVEVTKIQLK